MIMGGTCSTQERWEIRTNCSWKAWSEEKNWETVVSIWS